MLIENTKFAECAMKRPTSDFTLYKHVKTPFQVIFFVESLEAIVCTSDNFNKKKTLLDVISEFHEFITALMSGRCQHWITPDVWCMWLCCVRCIVRASNVENKVIIICSSRRPQHPASIMQPHTRMLLQTSGPVATNYILFDVNIKRTLIPLFRTETSRWI